MMYLTLWIRPLITYLGASLVVLLPLTQGDFSPSITLLLYGLAVIVVLSQVSDRVYPDLQDGHLAWLLSHGTSPFSYFLTNLMNSIGQIAAPLTLGFASIHLFIYPPPSVAVIAFSFLMTCTALLCWGLILTLAQGHNGQSLLNVMIAPLAIPNLLIAESLISTVAVEGEASYYLGMQFGITLVSFGLSLCLAPLVIRNLDW
ncbi:hypothetical protein [Candidatus Odyssella acanthamoebae]|uniref:Uncharacterized protein n=1 Tax=Candidatus Odyssella acanthamoebae TaxID=91604 RepID=A0A077AYR2_9PROT|nr:hypothetical protein [Candidatus Paracaedibacter acanthamoebae]AIK97144.1 hypothetical protein ID47_11010 [Candidatus Paracaedibacter acanthamoebae]